MPRKAAPKILSVGVSPDSASVGSTLTANVNVQGHPPPETRYQWKLDGQTIEGATGATYVTTRAGAFSVLVTAINNQGSASLESAAVLVSAPSVKPTVTSAEIAPSSGIVGDSFAVSASVEGHPEPTVGYQWRLDGVPISGATGPTHVAETAGRLTALVTATNSAGSASLESAAASVGIALVEATITSTDITPSSGVVGDSFETSASVDGSPEPIVGYQWLLDGVPISGATGPTYVAETTGRLSVVLTTQFSWTIS